MQVTVAHRDYSIDWLKTIGTLCLFLAHVNAPFWLNEIRGFDVPLMVFLSGLLSTGSLERVSSSKKYIINRTKRLVIPTWIFLVFFYFCMWVIGQLPDLMTIIKSFLFQRDGGLAGYTWIIWIYIVCSILTPFLAKIPIRIITIFCYIFFTIVYELICASTNLYDIRLLYYTVFTIIPYGLFMLYSIKFKEIPNKYNIAIAILLVATHIIYIIALYYKNLSYVPINTYKYPPRFYYFSYGLPVSIALIYLFKKTKVTNKPCALVSFVSKHSLWIYLWHIFSLSVLKYCFKIENWLILYIMLVVMSFGITYIQSVIVDILQKKHNFSALKYLAG